MFCANEKNVNKCCIIYTNEMWPIKYSNFVTKKKGEKTVCVVNNPHTCGYIKVYLFKHLYKIDQQKKEK